jgi:hypothetical protein
MPQVMEPDSWELGAFEHLAEAPRRNVAAVQGISHGVAEDEVLLLQPMSDAQQMLGLPRAVPAQHHEGGLSQFNRAPGSASV